MKAMLERAPKNTKRVLDVGSLDVNGTFRPMIEGQGWEYVGSDIRQGENVDVVSDDPDKLPFKAGEFDVVISGSTLEHVARPWLLVAEMVRVLKPGGLLAIVTHWKFAEHRYPSDYWRFLPDGMRVLFDDTGSLEDYQIAIVTEQDIIGSAIKKRPAPKKQAKPKKAG